MANAETGRGKRINCPPPRATLACRLGLFNAFPQLLVRTRLAHRFLTDMIGAIRDVCRQSRLPHGRPVHAAIRYLESFPSCGRIRLTRFSPPPIGTGTWST